MADREASGKGKRGEVLRSLNRLTTNSTSQLALALASALALTLAFTLALAFALALGA